MTTTILVIVCLLVLAAICAGGYYYFKAQGKKEEEVSNLPFDFKIEHGYVPSKGWFGSYSVGGVPYYGHIVNLSADAPIKVGDTLRVISEEYVSGNYVVRAIDLTSLPKGTIVTTHQDEHGNWRCMFAGPEGIAFVGQVLSDSKIPLKPNQQWRAIKHNDGYFSLVQPKEEHPL